MKVYHPKTGEVYEGEPVDCRELRQQAGFLTQEQHDARKLKEAGGEKEPVAPAAPTTEELLEAFKQLPAAVRAGKYLDSDFVVNQMRAHFGPLFTVDHKDQVEAIFKAAYEETTKKAPDETKGGSSAKVDGGKKADDTAKKS